MKIYVLPSIVTGKVMTVVVVIRLISTSSRTDIFRGTEKSIVDQKA